MKKQTFIIALIIVSLGFTSSLLAQEKLGNNPKTITVTFKNNSLLVRKYSFITYAPNETGNGTTADFMLPYATKEFKVVPGTKFYLASQKEVRVVMSGNRLAGAPFYIAKIEDDGKTVNLR
ncbi:hypothetical protein [Runella slithyformis]|uniref:Uncharacterized protein n=1 Tax=Runella slithyformis (strain ATCC 29530 / DSM 19594 / LMG 11500 / NCIMB 11436 / LSU 4) TaxID=761193 RepID=A0A7U3ZMC3_RUNSL|nr:hypothetical protein [Runella slithyformis]AEI49861.1 hypothetical protein Runsl_3497 [Runella slithyformis DSM 19594]